MAIEAERTLRKIVTSMVESVAIITHKYFKPKGELAYLKFFLDKTCF